MSDIGDNIRKKRKEKNFSQNQLAKKAGVSQSALSAIEKDVQNPSSQTVSLIAEALGCSLAELLGEEADEDVITPAERQLILVYRALNAQGKEYIRQQFAIAKQLYAGESGNAADLAL